MSEYVCAQCGGRFASDRDDEEAHAESQRMWGTRGDASHMAVVCDDCWQAFMAWWKKGQ